MAAITRVYTIGYVAEMLGEDEDWLAADSDEDAHPFRFDGARVSDMMSPIWHRLAG